MQELQVRSLFWEASTCHRTTKPRAPRLLNPVPGARAPQQERQPPQEALAWQLEGSPAGPTGEGPGTAAGGQPRRANWRKPGHCSWRAAPPGQPERAQAQQQRPSAAKTSKYITKKMSNMYYEVWINLFMLRGNINCLSLTRHLLKTTKLRSGFFFHISTFSQQAWISRRLILA